MQRTRIEKDLAPGHQRQQHPAGQSEGMEQRQRHHELVERREISHCANLRDVGKHRGMRVHHAFRLAFRPRSEQHDRRIIGLLPGRSAGREHRVPEHPQLIGHAKLCLEVLKVMNGDAVELIDHDSQSRLFDEAARGDDVLDASGSAGRTQTLGTGRVIEQCRHTATHRQAEHQSERRRGVGHQHTDDFARRREPVGHP